ncbi:hypothetical protein GGR39_001926 [Novosphingobium fluoreni]|uniref:Uncharacterized protein n=1 Tax=Novosphingobium fluoreni TaxID=1391222 RepID=A0A7W6C285_9SPHN|nr:hypothetical protein [Novosphingobium fluoreni]
MMPDESACNRITIQPGITASATCEVAIANYADVVIVKRGSPRSKLSR